MRTPPHPDEAFAAAIAGLYDAATAPALWPDALDALEPLFASSAAHFFLWDRAADRATLSLPSRNYRGQDEFHRRYGRIDPRRHLLMRQPPGFLLLCHEHFDEAFVRRSEFFNDFSLPLGRRWVMSASLWEDSASTAIFAVFRPPGQAPYAAADAARLRRLLPHLRRALRLDQQLRAARAQATIGQSVLDALPQAVLATDAAGRIRHANRAAEALLTAGATLRQHRGCLAATTHAETAMLLAALRRAVEAAPGATPGPASSLILHDEAGAALAVTVTPLDRHAGLDGMPEQRLALLTAVPMAPQRADPAPLRLAFGFTGAEAALAAALAGGQRLAAIAAARGVRMPTVRHQLRAVFDKTGTNRQAELVRVLANLPRAAQPTVPPTPDRGRTP